MQEIKCPKCGEVFQVDESGYAAIVKQVRDDEFRKDLEERVKILEAEKTSAVKLAVLEAENRKDKRISELDAFIKALETDKDSAVKLAVAEKDKVIADITASMNELKAEAKIVIEQLEAQKEKAVSKKDLEISELTGKLNLANNNLALEIKNAVQQKEVEIINLQNQAKLLQSAWELKEKTACEKFDEQIRLLNEQVAYYRDFKARQSTKMIGESLEKHCETEFNRIRATAFPGAYFEKDNDARSGSKGDYIYRETTEDGIEVISIMFEMKNEADTTATKHKNEDFLKELDKDRREKNCDFAILVSMLESDSEYYNSGIVDVSYRYEKMYVIRPQFFIPIISLLRNNALNNVACKRELAAIQCQNIDITHFEEDLNEFKDKFGRNFRLASDWYDKAIDEIDKSISHMQKVKDALLASQNNLRLANNKAEDLSIKRLVAHNPTMAAMFAELKEAT